MEKLEGFLSDFPKYKTDAFFLEDVKANRRRDSLDDHLGLLKLTAFRALFASKFLKTRELRSFLQRKEVEKESNKIEGALFKIALKRRVGFDDLVLKDLFYRELGEFRHLFYNTTEDLHFRLLDLFLIGFHFGEDPSDAIKTIVVDMTIPEKLYYCAILQPVLKCEHVIAILHQIPISLCSEKEIQCLIFSISRFSEEQRYSSISEILVGIPDSECQRVIGFLLDEGWDRRRVAVALVRLICASAESLGQKYISCLRLTKSLKLSYKDNLRILYCLMSYFLYYRQYTVFVQLFESVVETAAVDSAELLFYKKCFLFLSGRVSIEEVQDCVSHCNLNQNEFCMLTFEDIIGKLSDVYVSK